MRRRGLLLLALSLCVSPGCLIGKPTSSASWLQRGLSGPGSDAGDLVVIDMFLCESYIGDRALNEEIWALADDQVVSLEHKALLEQNGFRVGQVGGVPPAEVQSLLGSKKTCPDPRRLQQHCGKPARLTLGPPVPQCRFLTYLEDQNGPAELEQAEFALVVVPTPAPGGRTRLRFTPEARHGQAAVLPTPTFDRSAWMFQKQQPSESYQSLSWEVTLGPNDYAIVGGRFDRAETLGRQSFVRSEETPPRQRLLIIRAARQASGVVNDGVPRPDDWTASKSPPLALQAGWTTFRGVCP
jgi:hypothetical protein